MARLPLLNGVLPIEGTKVPVDVIAGVTLAALAIPEVIGYTSIAGMPVVTGLYTILLPIFAFALLGSSRHLVVGADSATAAVMAAALGSPAVAGSSQYVALAGLLGGLPLRRLALLRQRRAVQPAGHRLRRRGAAARLGVPRSGRDARHRLHRR
jgi:MFS superfamily sulfate permease-like transporter